MGNEGEPMSYDPKCYELAEYFAEDEVPPLKPHELDQLAQDIQTAIEDYLQYGRKEKAEPLDDR